MQNTRINKAVPIQNKEWQLIAVFTAAQRGAKRLIHSEICENGWAISPNRFCVTG